MHVKFFILSVLGQLVSGYVVFSGQTVLVTEFARHETGNKKSTRNIGKMQFKVLFYEIQSD
jgi:hypothetical protein